MKLDDNSSSFKIIRRVIAITFGLICILVAVVFASKNDVNYITIEFSDDTQISVVTTKVNVGEILEENNIVLLPDEKVIPNTDSTINASKLIQISKITEKPVVIAEEETEITTEQILGSYVTVSEKIITEQVEIPFETVTKDVSQSGSETVDKVLQEGQNGLKEIKYKVRYEDDVEVKRDVISETVIKEPVEKIIQISTKVVSRSNSYRASSATSLSARVEGITPRVTTLNVSAYTAATCGKSASDPSYGKTASGARASSWYTVAAGPGIPMGTIIYVPYFASQPNGGWFVVEDRGGAISNSRLDIYMGTTAECYSFGRRNLECYIY